MTLQAPFPWFGGKSRVADLVWKRFGDTPNYVEPFFGSGAVLLKRPHAPKIETVNDLDGYVANAWRAIKNAPDEVAHYADNPVVECDMHARHIWLRGKREELNDRLSADMDYYDAKIAGWWIWGMAVWIGSGWCGDSGRGPWVVEDGKLVKQSRGQGVKRQLPHLGNAGQGVKRQLPHLGDAGQGVKRQRPHLGNAGRGVKRNVAILNWMNALSERMERVRVCNGDWSRVTGDSVTVKNGVTAVFLDPPYSAEAGRDMNIYTEESLTVAHDVREWAIANGDNPKLRIALCGYEGEHVMPDTWECVPWKASGGYGNQKSKGLTVNRHRERIWFSPHCLNVEGDVSATQLLEYS